MQAHCQSINLFDFVRPCDFSKLALDERLDEEALVQPFALLERAPSLIRRCFRGSDGIVWWRGSTPPGRGEAPSPHGILLAQAQNLDGDVVRPAAFPRQFDQLTARLFRTLVFHRVENLRVVHLPPQSVAADQEDVLGP